MKFERHKKLTPSTKPMQAMVDAGMLVDPPSGRIPTDYCPVRPIILNDDFVYALPLQKVELNAE